MICHGTTTLFAALDTATGQVITQCKQRHRQPLARKAMPTGQDFIYTLPQPTPLDRYGGLHPGKARTVVYTYFLDVRLAGHFDWRLPGDTIRVDSPFELYLQRGAKEQSWRRARPSGSTDGSSQDWITDPLPLPGESRG